MDSNVVSMFNRPTGKSIPDLTLYDPRMLQVAKETIALLHRGREPLKLYISFMVMDIGFKTDILPEFSLSSLLADNVLQIGIDHEVMRLGLVKVLEAFAPTMVEVTGTEELVGYFQGMLDSILPDHVEYKTS